MSFVDPFLLTVTLVMTIILIVGNLYFVAKYAHPQDAAFGSSTAIKTIIVMQLFVTLSIDSSIYMCGVLNSAVASRCG